MKRISLFLGLTLTILFLSCKEDTQGIQGEFGEGPADPSIQPRVVWVWLDSPRPYSRWDLIIPNKHNDSLPIGYSPGRLLVRFNKIMLSYTVIPNVSISPSGDDQPQLSTYGSYSVDGQTFEWPIYGKFKIKQTYQITVSKKATDVNNLTINTDYIKSIIPEPNLRIRYADPMDGDSLVGTATIPRFIFNSEIDSNSLKSSATIVPPVSGRWNFRYYPGSLIEFIPQYGFKGNTLYEFIFAQSLKDIYDNFLPKQVKIKFKTMPFIVQYAYPSNGAQNVSRSAIITCYFTAALDTSTVRQNFNITPSVSGNYFYYSYNRLNFLPIAGLAQNTNYTVTILSGLRSKAGDNLSSPYTFSFTTGSD